MTSPNILSADELKQWWGDWSTAWEEYYEQVTLPLTQTLLTWTQVRNASSILEVACGSGAGTRLCNYQKAQNASLTCIDISSEMVEKTKLKVNDTSVKALVANSEALPFEDGAFDRYYASFCLHLTPDPDQMLKEASRVVRKGGIAAFSVWGRRENCLQMTFMNPITSSLGIDFTSKNRSPFHLGADEEGLKKRAIAAGFTKCITFYQLHPMPFAEADVITKTLLAPPTTQKVLSALPKEKLQELIEKSNQFVNDCINRGQPITMEALVLVAFKY